MRTLELTKINRDAEFDSYSDTDDVTERQVGEAAAPANTSPVTIAVESIRCFYPRKNNKPGTRITFKDGGGFAVAELYDEVKQRVNTN